MVFLFFSMLLFIIMMFFLCLMTFMTLFGIVCAEGDLAIMAGAAKLSLIQYNHGHRRRPLLHLKQRWMA